MPITALAPCSPACCKRSSKASSRVLSHRFVRRVILPPQIVCSAAPRFPIRLRERTTIPRTIPKFLTIRYPGKSSPQVTIPASTLGISAMLAGVLQKKLEGILARSLAQIRKKSDIAAPNRLQRSPKISDQAARAHHDSANDPEIPHNPIPRQIQPASNHSRIDSWHLSLLEEMERLMKPSFTTVDGCDSSRFIRAP